MSYGPDPITHLSYSCNTGAPNVFLHRRARDRSLLQAHPLPVGQGVHRGLRRDDYCPGQAVTRDAMAKFLDNAFALQLYGP